MTMLVLDSGGLSRLSERSPAALALIRALQREGLWPPTVPTAVLVESLTGDGRRDARAHQLLKACHIEATLPVARARRAAWLRTRVRRGSAVDAIVVATAEPGGVVLTGDPHDLAPLAARATRVRIETI
jgi:hypothetical protein